MGVSSFHPSFSLLVFIPLCLGYGTQLGMTTDGESNVNYVFAKSPNTLFHVLGLLELISETEHKLKYLKKKA